MISLDFKGPFHFEDLLSQNDAKNPGVYIWGFKYPDNNIFIPYYVGKKLSNIIDRIKQHKKEIKTNDSTYTRISENFMKSFYTHDKLESLIKSTKSHTKVPDWFKDFPADGVEYLNARWFIHLKTNHDPGRRTEYPISLIKPMNDFLKSQMDDLFICYAVPIENDEIVSPDDNLYEYLESITKISLKGKTFGNFEKPVDSNTFHYKDQECCVNIKNKANPNDPLFYLFKDEFSNKIFPGY